TRSNGQPNTNFTGALGHRHQHDIHDSDAAHQQTDSGHSRQQGGHHLGGRTHRLSNLTRIHYREIIVLVRLQVAPFAHQYRDLLNQHITVYTILRRNIDLGNIMYGGAPEQPALQGAQWEHYRVVLIANTGLPFCSQYANHFTGRLANTYLGSNW